MIQVDKQSTSQRLFIVIVGMLLAAGAAAQNLTVKTGSTPAPTEVPPPGPGVLVAPMSDAEGDQRESLLGTHHREIPLGPPPPGVLAVPPPPAESLPAPAAAPFFELNRGLTDAETRDVTSTVNEPSAAARGSEVLLTANWFAAFSTDAGASFSYMNPATTFPAITDQRFCCDQVALYEPDSDLMVWFLQYVTSTTGNTVRLAVAQGADIPARQWRFYDFTPQSVGGWANEWFDYPDLAVSDDFLYVTTNAFSTQGTQPFTRSLILRLPLAELEAYQPLNFAFWDTTQFGSLRLTQGATDTMYFASHNSVASIRLFSWPESANTIGFNDIPVTAWSSTGARPGWTSRSDHRITAAWRTGNQVGLGWTAAAGAPFPHPHARIAIVDLTTMAVVAEPHLWNQNFPFAYPAAAPNGSGDVAIGVHFGTDPNHAVGILAATNPPTWDLVTTATGTDSPASETWGDYTSVRAHGSDPEAWIATGFTLQGGTDRRDVQVQYVRFREVIPGVPVISLQTEDPNRELRDGQSMWVRATVTVNGAPEPGVTVSFTASSSALTLTPSSAVTDASGIAEITATSTTNSEETVTVTATAAGATPVTTTVLVPALSTWIALALVLSIALLVGFFGRRETSR